MGAAFNASLSRSQIVQVEITSQFYLGNSKGEGEISMIDCFLVDFVGVKSCSLAIYFWMQTWGIVAKMTQTIANTLAGMVNLISKHPFTLLRANFWQISDSKFMNGTPSQLNPNPGWQIVT